MRWSWSGRRKFSNSVRLVEVAQRAGCAQAMLVERASAIDWSQFEGIATLGITAGASAPETLVDEVIEAFAAAVRHHGQRAAAQQRETIVFNLPRELRAVPARMTRPRPCSRPTGWCCRAGARDQIGDLVRLHGDPVVAQYLSGAWAAVDDGGDGRRSSRSGSTCSRRQRMGKLRRDAEERRRARRALRLRRLWARRRAGDRLLAAIRSSGARAMRSRRRARCATGCFARPSGPSSSASPTCATWRRSRCCERIGDDRRPQVEGDRAG